MPHRCSLPTPRALVPRRILRGRGAGDFPAGEFAHAGMGCGSGRRKKFSAGGIKLCTSTPLNPAPAYAFGHIRARVFHVSTHCLQINNLSRCLPYWQSKERALPTWGWPAQPQLIHDVIHRFCAQPGNVLRVRRLEQEVHVMLHFPGCSKPLISGRAGVPRPPFSVIADQERRSRSVLTGPNPFEPTGRRRVIGIEP